MSFCYWIAQINLFTGDAINNLTWILHNQQISNSLSEHSVEFVKLSHLHPLCGLFNYALRPVNSADDDDDNREGIALYMIKVSISVSLSSATVINVRFIVFGPGAERGQ